MSSEIIFKRLTWLIVGGLCGLLFAGYGIFTKISINQTLDSNTIATVNNALITRETYLRAIDRYNSDTKDALDKNDRAWVLQRLIEEELLVQRGLSLGIITTDNDVRGAIVRALIASINAEAAAMMPNEEELFEYYNSNEEKFTYPATISIQAWVSSTEEDALLLKKGLLENKESEKYENIRFLKNIPSGLLTLNKIREYLGPSIASAIKLETENNVIIQYSQDRWYIVYIIEKNVGVVEPFENIKHQIHNEFIRSEADKKLREYINNLKDNASIAYSNEAL
ncbi:MAG: peptidylprolyl isomerase [Pseudomonadota bacterium]|nr:peptidylprolyl isomerase [Pseudomonadota bacterium]